MVKKRGYYVYLFTSVCLCLFLADLGGRDLWDIDEGMNAAIARTMLSTGEWITPTFNGQAFLDKPPLFNWMTAASFSVFGLSEFAARLPSALCGLGTVLLTFLIGRKVYSATSAALASIILATSLYFLALARVVQYDVPFTFFTTLVMYFYVAASSADRIRLPSIGICAAAAFAVLIKGPLGVVIPGLAIAGHLLLTRGLSMIPRLLNPVAILVFVLIAAPWYVLMERANPGYLHYFILQQHVANLLGSASTAVARHPEPFYFYLAAMVLALLPWSLTLPQSIYGALKNRESEGNNMSLFFVIWVLGTLLLLSVAASKLSNYVLPILPAAALILGRYWARLLSMYASRRKPDLVVVLGIAAVVLGTLAIYAILAEPWIDWETQLGIRWSDAECFIVAFSSLFSVALIFASLGMQRATFVTLASVSPFAMFYFLMVLAPATDAFKGAKEIGLELDRLLPASEEIRYIGRMPDSAMFYTARNAVNLRTEKNLREYLGNEKCVYVLLAPRGRNSDDVFDSEYFVVSKKGNKLIVSGRTCTESGPRAGRSRVVGD